MERIPVEIIKRIAEGFPERNSRGIFKRNLKKINESIPGGLNRGIVEIIFEGIPKGIYKGSLGEISEGTKVKFLKGILKTNPEVIFKKKILKTAFFTRRNYIRNTWRNPKKKNVGVSGENIEGILIGIPKEILDGIPGEISEGIPTRSPGRSLSRIPNL